ncbi:MAG: alpha/beta fold hydrolase [Chitinophagaceae bacterium]
MRKIKDHNTIKCIKLVQNFASILNRTFFFALTLLICLQVSSCLFAQDKFFNSNGLQIHYLEQGTGVPVVLVHGRGGSLQSWIDSGVLLNLAKDHRVIALDCRGHGKSSKPHDPKQYGQEMALDILRLLDHLAIGKAHIIGYSLGGNITAQLLVIHPERFLTATLAGAAGRFQWTAKDDHWRTCRLYSARIRGSRPRIYQRKIMLSSSTANRLTKNSRIN